jgi:acetyltransferase-like isoleucine patch superfamily enzyme
MHQAYARAVLDESTLELHWPCFIEPLSGVQVGKRVAINAFVHIWANERVTIGDDSMIASHVRITTSTHDYHMRPYRNFRRDSPVFIGRNVWVGTGATILPGVTIGDDAVVGAGSVVTRDVEARTVVAGVPAKVIRRL